MIDKGVAKRYAHALFGAARNADAIEPILGDLDSLEAMIETDPSLVRFLASPRELDEHKEAVIEKLFLGRTHELTVRLLLLLLRKGRILHLQDVIAAYRSDVEVHQGVAAAKAITAVPLASDLQERLRTELERITDRKVRIKAQVDPRILGGLVVMIEGKILDRSVRHAIDQMRESLLAVRVH